MNASQLLGFQLGTWVDLLKCFGLKIFENNIISTQQKFYRFYFENTKIRKYNKNAKVFALK